MKFIIIVVYCYEADVEFKDFTFGSLIGSLCFCLQTLPCTYNLQLQSSYVE